MKINKNNSTVFKTATSDEKVVKKSINNSGSLLCKQKLNDYLESYEHLHKLD